LSLRLFEYLGISGVDDVINAVYSYPSPKELIAGFAGLVVEEVRAGDEVAMKIIKEVAREIVLALYTASKALGGLRSFSVVEGFYEASRDIIKPLIVRGLKRVLGRGFELREQAMPLEGAAVMLSLKSVNQP